VVAFGVLLDTFVVRSVLVPAIALDLGRKTWIPSSLSKGGESGTETAEPPAPTSPAPGSPA